MPSGSDWNDRMKINADRITIRSHEPHLPSNISPGMKKNRILIVENDNLIAGIISPMLEKKDISSLAERLPVRTR